MKNGNGFLDVKNKAKKRSYTELAYESIKELIIREEIEPGELLSENQLSEYLEMSRTPVREAIRRLEADGILEAKKGVGTFVKVLSMKDIRDIYEVRETLEVIASETAIENISTEEILELKNDFIQLLESYTSGKPIDRMEFAILDTRIHDLLLERSTNEFVKLLMERINFYCLRYRILSFKISLNLEESTTQHLELIACILEKDMDKIQAKIRNHTQWSLKILQENLREL